MIAALLLAAALLAATYLLWRNEESARDERRQQVFGMAVERVVSSLSDRIASFEMVLRGVKGYREGSNAIDFAEFHVYADALNLRSATGWKCTNVVKRLDETRIVRVEHCTSFSDKVTAAN